MPDSFWRDFFLFLIVVQLGIIGGGVWHIAEVIQNAR